MNGFTESLRQEVGKRHVRVGVLEPGEVATELVSHNSEIVKAALSVNKNDAPLNPEDVADGIAFMVHSAAPRCDQRAVDHADQTSVVRDEVIP